MEDTSTTQGTSLVKVAFLLLIKKFSSPKMAFTQIKSSKNVIIIICCHKSTVHEG